VDRCPGKGSVGAKIAVGDQATWFELKATFGAQSPYAAPTGLLIRCLPTFRECKFICVLHGFMALSALINTDRHAYHKELRSTERTYMASVSWIYPQDELVALRRQNASAAAANLVIW
jgi:hypothetical protein